MSLYSERLAKLKKEIIISSKKKKKRWNNNQKIMLNFINGVTKNAIFIINEKSITLRLGDKNKGFLHILEKYYCSNCLGKISAIDILNIADIAKRGLKLNHEGVSNNNLIVYQKIKSEKRHNLVLLRENETDLVVTAYSIG